MTWILKTFLSTIVLVGIIQKGYALVEYSESKPGVSPRNNFKSNNERYRSGSGKNVVAVSNASESSKKAGDDSYGLEVSSRYESIKISGVNSSEDRIGVMRFEGYLQTPYNIFANIEYFMAQRNNQESEKKQKWQKGNPTFLLGINWLRLGMPAERTEVNMYGGISPGMKNSTIATTRDDKIVGLLTTKNFYSIVLGLQGELRVVGTPKGADEMMIGNMTKLAAKLGWVISNDIRFQSEFASYLIRPSSQTSPAPPETGSDRDYLNRKMSYNMFSSELLLEFFPSLEFLLGANINLNKKIDEAKIIKTRLFASNATYENTIYLGLNFSL